MLLFFCCFDGSPSDGKLTRHINLGEARETGSHLWGDEWRDVFVCACVGVTCIPAPRDRTLDAAFLDKQPGAACQEPAWHFFTTAAFVGRVSARRSQKHLPIVVETNVKKNQIPAEVVIHVNNVLITLELTHMCSAPYALKFWGLPLVFFNAGQSNRKEMRPLSHSHLGCHAAQHPVSLLRLTLLCCDRVEEVQDSSGK